MGNLYSNIADRNITRNWQVFIKFPCSQHYVKSIQIRSFSGPYFPVFSPNTGKYGPEKLSIWTLLTQWKLILYVIEKKEERFRLYLLLYFSLFVTIALKSNVVNFCISALLVFFKNLAVIQLSWSHFWHQFSMKVLFFFVRVQEIIYDLNFAQKRNKL